MCTVIYNEQLTMLAKNRDKTSETEEEIVHEREFIAIRTKNADYYSLGLNKYGVAFVSTAVNTPEWTALAAAGRTDEALRLSKKENEGLTSPIITVSSMLPEAKSIFEIRSELAKNKKKWKGYNVILADNHDAVVLEVHDREIHERKLKSRDAITNHFKFVSHGPQKISDYASSFYRLKFAEKKIQETTSIKDFYEILKYAPSDIDQQIWREGHFATVSSTIIDLYKLCLYYSASSNGDYKEITLTSV